MASSSSYNMMNKSDRNNHNNHHTHHNHNHHQDDKNDKQKMGRGKIDIKPITNPTNRQVTYSKRRSGIFKKAKELEVLCDAKVSVLMVSHNNHKVHEYISPGVTTKEMIDLYQQNTGTDLWKPQYERMKETLRQLKEKNYQLKKEIRQRMGHDLEDLNFHELTDLETNMADSVVTIRAQKYKKIKTHTETMTKKVKSLENNNLTLLHNYQAVEENIEAGIGYEHVMALTNGASNLYAFRNAQVGPFDSYNLHDLRLG